MINHARVYAVGAVVLTRSCIYCSLVSVGPFQADAGEASFLRGGKKADFGLSPVEGLAPSHRSLKLSMGEPLFAWLIGFTTFSEIIQHIRQTIILYIKILKKLKNRFLLFFTVLKNLKNDDILKTIIENLNKKKIIGGKLWQY